MLNKFFLGGIVRYLGTIVIFHDSDIQETGGNDSFYDDDIKFCVEYADQGKKCSISLVKVGSKEMKDRGSVCMGSVGSWESISFLTMGSGTHPFWKKTSRINPLFT